MLLVDLNYNFEFDWFVELSNNKLSDNKLSNNKLSDNTLASELVGNRSFFKPITIEEIAIFMINSLTIGPKVKASFYLRPRQRSGSSRKGAYDFVKIGVEPVNTLIISLMEPENEE